MIRVLFALLLLALPALGQSTLTVNGVAVTVTGGSHQIDSTAEGVRITAGRHVVETFDDRIELNGRSIPIAGPDAIAVARGEYGIAVRVHGTVVAEVTELEGLMQAAEAGDPGAQNNLGVRYANGDGVPQDGARAMDLYQAAAEQGLATAQSNLGFNFWSGDLGTQDRKMAFYWASQAAAQEHTAAQRLVGFAYLLGEGVAQNLPEAIASFEAAAAKGDALSLNELGVMYGTGHGVPEDQATAFGYYRQAAEAGLPVALSNLAVMYRDGRGTEVDLDRAEALFEEAAAAGHPSAEGSLAALRAARAEAEPEAPAEAWWFAEDNRPVGPVDRAALVEAVAAGRVTGTTLVWRDGMADWAAAGDVPDLAALLAE